MFVVIGSLSIIAPLGVYFVMGARHSATLGGWKEWLAAHESAVMVVLLLVFGVVLVGKGIPRTPHDFFRGLDPATSTPASTRRRSRCR